MVPPNSDGQAVAASEPRREVALASLPELRARVGRSLSAWVEQKWDRRLAVEGFAHAIADIAGDTDKRGKGAAHTSSTGRRLVLNFDLHEALTWCRRQANLDRLTTTFGHRSRWELTPEDAQVLELAHWYLTTPDPSTAAPFPAGIDPNVLLRCGSARRLIRLAIEAQQRGDLRAVTSRELVEGLLCGLAAQQAARTVLAEDQYPLLNQRDHEIVSEILYRTYLFIDAFLINGQTGDPLIYRWCLARAVSVACGAEINRRLDQSASGQHLWAVLSRNDGAALDELLRPILKLTWSFDLTGSGGLVRQEGDSEAGYGRPVDDDKRSVLRLALWSRISEIVTKGAAAVLPEVAMIGLPEWARRLAALCLLIDGKFENLPFEVRCDFLDYIRQQTAEKRGGGTVPDSIDDPEFTGFSSLIAPQATEADADLAWQDVTRWLTVRTREIPDVAAAFPLLQLQIATADEGLLQKEIAARLGCTPRTVQNQIKSVEPLRQRLRDYARGRPTPPWADRLRVRRRGGEPTDQER